MKKIKNFLKNELILALIFWLWIFFIMIISEILFIINDYNNLDKILKQKLVSKNITLQTIVKNRYIYAEKKDDYTLYQLVKKWLENSLITINWEIKINNFPKEFIKSDIDIILNIKDKSFINLNNYKIYKSSFDENIITYVISEKNYGFKYYLNIIILFILINILVFIFSIIISFLFIKRVLLKIEKNIQLLKEFTNDINHEIKTPLTIIKSSLDLYKKENGENEYINDSLNAVKNIDNTLSWVTEIALYIENFKQLNETIYIKKEIENIIKIYENLIKQKDLNIIINIKEKHKINVLKNDLLICISNILKNAIKYSKNKWKIWISVKKNTIEIKDNWVWISQKNLDKIFNRFYSDKKDYWTWIWLSIIKKICEKNWRKIEVKSTKQVETIFKIIF